MTQVEINNKLIKELAECISLLVDNDYGGYTAEYIIDRYLSPIIYNSESYTIKDSK
jgi:hypothetical protein